MELVALRVWALNEFHDELVKWHFSDASKEDSFLQVVLLTNCRVSVAVGAGPMEDFEFFWT